MVPACHKLAWMKDVQMSNLGLRKVKQETTAPQMILIHQTTQHEKQKHCKPNSSRYHHNTARWDFVCRITGQQKNKLKFWFVGNFKVPAELRS